MSNWTDTKLGKMALEVRDLYEPSQRENLPYIGLEHISQGDLGLVGVGSSNETRSSKKMFQNGDILFGTLRPYFRKVVRPNFHGVCSTDITILRSKKGYSQDFLFYLIASQPLIDYASVTSNGTKMPRAKWKVLAKTNWLVPDFSEQRAIASILSAYDNLIENNGKRITLLEQISEQIYREWFVRMRFPGYEDAELEKGVPKDWNEMKFQKFIQLQRGHDLPEDKIREGIYPIAASTSIKGYHHEYKIKPPCITTGRSGSLGIVLFINEKCWPLNTTLYVKDFKGNSPFYVYYTLKEMRLERFNSGAGVPTLNRNHLNTLKIVVPNKEIQEKFDKIISPVFELKEKIIAQNKNLKQTRDFLLPRLLSGKLRVKDVKEETITEPKLHLQTAKHAQFH